jgi:hypothetical protein
MQGFLFTNKGKCPQYENSYQYVITSHMNTYFMCVYIHIESRITYNVFLQSFLKMLSIYESLHKFSKSHIKSKEILEFRIGKN